MNKQPLAKAQKTETPETSGNYESDTTYYKSNLKDGREQALLGSKIKTKKTRYDVCAIIAFIIAIIPDIILIYALNSPFQPGSLSRGAALLLLYFGTGLGYIMFPVSIIFGIVALKSENKNLWSRILSIIGIGMNIITIVWMILISSH